MKQYFIFSVLLFTLQVYSQCMEDECGPHPGMPNYLCLDGNTMGGPSECTILDNGECGWEIITCPQITFTGYIREIDVSWCMDNCSNYYIETESGDYLSNITDLDGMGNLNYFKDRYVVVTGEEVWCVECGAVDVDDIAIAENCEIPVDCFQDPCMEANCLAYPNAECISTYCGGCYADFYQNNDLITDCSTYSNCSNLNSCSDCTDADCFWQPTDNGICDDECVIADLECYGSAPTWSAECPEESECIDLTGLFFGLCEMYLGIGYSDDYCQYISGCDWIVDGVDYYEAFFESMDECEDICSSGNMTCDEISQNYEELHSGVYATCEYDNDCISVWGDCDVGLGGCHYSVNVANYPEEELDELVDLWVAGDCMSWVCDCSAEPYAQCIGGTCSSAYCMSQNPAGCFQTGCDEGYECIISDECVPSWCECDGLYGNWYCTEDCGGGTCFTTEGVMGDLNNDGFINVIDIVIAVDTILEGEYNLQGDLNGDDQFNIVDIIQLVNLILNPISEDCYIIPEIGPCDGICPTYYFNQETSQCEGFITGCCGVEVFSTMDSCIEACE